MGDRDELLKASWETFYDASYYQILFEEVSKRWQTFDFITRLLVAVTASGSTIAGWALWNDDGFKCIWLFTAGFASLISIVHATLNTPEKVKNYSKLADGISTVCHEYETFRQELKIYPDFNVDEKYNNHKALRLKYTKALEAFSPDFLTTEKIQNDSQTMLNSKLGIEEE